jgi:hypothetical protein
MFEKIFWFGAGFLVARYLILNTPDYREKEAQKIDELRGSIHELIKKYAPQADDYQVSQDVMSTV